MLERRLERVRKIKVKSELEEEWRKKECVVWRGSKLSVVNKEEGSWGQIFLLPGSWDRKLIVLTPCVVPEMSLILFQCM